MAAPTYTTSCTAKSFNLLAVDTATDCVVTCGLEDCAILHLNLQCTDTDPAVATISVSTDGIFIMDSQDASNGNTLDPGTAAGSTSHKLFIKAGGNATIRGYDLKNTGTTTSRSFTIRAVGHTAYVQIGRGSTWGTTP